MPYASESFLRTAAREGKKMWPFLAGFAFVGTAVTYATSTITSEDKKASKFLNPGGALKRRDVGGRIEKTRFSFAREREKGRERKRKRKREEGKVHRRMRLTR